MKKFPALLLVAIAILFTFSGFSQAGPTPTINLSSGTQYICNTGKDTLFYSLSAQNIPANTNIVIYQGTDSLFNPYLGQGDSIAFVPGQAIPKDTLNFGSCVKIIGEFIDACGPSGQEGRNEYIVLTSGTGFRVNNLGIDFSSQNNSGNNNHDININATPCSYKTPDATLIANLRTGSCNASNVIPASPGDSIPPNAIVVCFTSDSVSASYSLNGLCNKGYPIYILQSACVRTIGAFTNAPRCDAPARYRTTFAVDQGKNCSSAFTYDLCGIYDLDGTYGILQPGIDTASVANNGIRRNTIDSCGGIDYTQFAFSSDTTLKYALQNPNVDCNTLYYLKAITHPNGTQPVSNTIPFELVCVDVNTVTRANSICSGETANITIGSTTPNATFSWTVSGGTNISGASAGTGNTISQALVNTGNAADSVTYHIQALSNGCTASQNVTIRVNRCAADTLYMCAGDSVQLDGPAGYINYSWLPTTALSNPSIEDPKASPAVTTKYIVTANDSVNIISNGGFENALTGWSTDYPLYTNQNPPFGTYSIDSSAQNIYFGYCANPDVTVNGKYYLIVDGSTNSISRILYRTIPVQQNTSYLFQFWAMPLTSTSIVPTFDVKFNGSVLINDLVLDTTTCRWKRYTYTWNSASATSLNLEIIDVRASGQGNDFAMDEIALKKGNIVKDSVVVVVNPKPVPVINGNLTVCNGNSTTLTATGQFDSVRWSNNSTTTSINVSQAGAYTVTAYKAGCSGTASVNVQIGQTRVLIDGDTSICNGGQTVLTATGGPFDSVRWSTNETTTSINVTQAGTYTVTVYSGNCSATDDVQVTSGSVAVQISGTTTICPNGSADLSVSGQYDSVRWSTNETTLSIVVSQPGQYSVTAYIGGCSGSAAVNVLGLNPPMIMDLGNDTMYCGPFERILSTGDQATVWSTGVTAAQITVNQPDTYIATITNACGSISDSIMLWQSPLPAVDLGDDTTICTGQIILSVPQVYRSYIWSTGEQTSSITVTSPGIYSIIISDGTCENSDSIEISLSCENSIYIPNAFTPNDDHVNDVFYVRGNPQNLSIQKMVIYDRWGEKVFEANDILPDDPASGWDGMYKNKPAQKEVYGYYVIAKFADGEEKKFKGNVTLFR